MTTPNVPLRFELELTVDGTPEQVWQAIATAEGISGWMVPTELDPRVGGRLQFDMGPEVDMPEATVTGYEPGRRFAYEEDLAALAGHPGAEVSPLATEFLIEAKSGGTCVVRIVSSAFGTGADWENEFWGEMDSGFAPMLDNLRVYLRHFAGQPVTPVQSKATFTGTVNEVADRARAALGAAGVGDRVELAGMGAVVERILPHNFLLRIERPVHGMIAFQAWQAAEGATLNAGAFVYGDDGAAEAEQLQKQLQSWLDDLTQHPAATTS